MTTQTGGIAAPANDKLILALPKGRILGEAAPLLRAAGIHPEPAEINLTSLVRMHQQIRGSYRAPIASWDGVISFLDGHQDLMRNLISHTLPLSNALDGFQAAQDHTASKVILRMGEA